jgi:hypothetical protein
MTKGYRYLSIVFMRNSLGIHYDNLGSYKELLDLGEAKARRVNELVILTIHLAEVMEDVIEVLAIDILPCFPSDATAMLRKSGHVHSRKWLIVIR